MKGAHHIVITWPAVNWAHGPTTTWLLWAKRKEIQQWALCIRIPHYGPSVLADGLGLPPWSWTTLAVVDSAPNICRSVSLVFSLWLDDASAAAWVWPTTDARSLSHHRVRQGVKVPGQAQREREQLAAWCLDDVSNGHAWSITWKMRWMRRTRWLNEPVPCKCVGALELFLVND
jgi:hypothetical protein